jgi:hypothetical protein
MLLESAAIVLNNTIVGNTASEKGGAAIYCNASPALIEGNVLAHHESGPAVFWLSDEAPATLRGNVVWGRGGSHGGACPAFIGRDGNCEADPQYVDWTAGDFRSSPPPDDRDAACLARAGAALWDPLNAPDVPDSIVARWRTWRAETESREASERRP